MILSVWTYLNVNIPTQIGPCLQKDCTALNQIVRKHQCLMSPDSFYTGYGTEQGKLFAQWTYSVNFHHNYFLQKSSGKPVP